MCGFFPFKNPIIEPCLWHVKYLGHGAAENVMTGIRVKPAFRSDYIM